MTALCMFAIVTLRMKGMDTKCVPAYLMPTEQSQSRFMCSPPKCFTGTALQLFSEHSVCTDHENLLTLPANKLAQ